MTRLTPKIVSALLLSAFAGSADAQFVADKTSPASPTSASDSRSGSGSLQTIVTTTDDGTVYKLVARDGSVDGVWVNNEPVAADRIVKGDRVVRIIDEKGNTVHEFKLASPEFGVRVAPSGDQVLRLGMTAEAGQDGQLRIGVVPSIPPAPPAPISRVAPVDRPPVMLGINLSEPGEALRAQLGLGDKPAILIDGVIDGLPADEAGIRQYDIVVSIEGSDGASGEMLTKALREKKPGDTLKLKIVRGGEKKTVEAKLVGYDSKKLGHDIEIISDDAMEFPQTWIERDGNVTRFGQNSDELKQRLNELHVQRTEQAQQMSQEAYEQAMRRTEEIQRKVEQAMRDAERSVIELRRDGRLFVRPAEEKADELRRTIEDEYRSRAPQVREELDQRLDAMEQRFAALEQDLQGRLERLTAIMERLADRLEKVANDRDED